MTRAHPVKVPMVRPQDLRDHQWVVAAAHRRTVVAAGLPPLLLHSLRPVEQGARR